MEEYNNSNNENDDERESFRSSREGSGKNRKKSSNSQQQQQQQPEASRGGAKRAPATTSNDDLRERMERKMTAFSPNTSTASAPSAQSASAMTSRDTNDDLRDRTQPKIRADENERASSRSSDGAAAAASMNSHSSEDAATPLVGVPASRRPRRNQRPSRHTSGSLESTISSASRPAANTAGSGMLLEMSSSGIGEWEALDLKVTGPVVPVARAPTRASSVEIPTVSSHISGSASAPLAQTTQVSKEGPTLMASQSGSSPGAYQIQGRAVGARPEWVQRVGNNIRGNLRGSNLRRSSSDDDMGAAATQDRNDQSHLPPESRTNTDNNSILPEMRTVALMEPSGTFLSVDFTLAEPLPVGAAKVREDELARKKKRRFWIVVAIAVGVIAAVGAGVGVSISGGGNSDGSSSSNDEDTIETPATSAPNMQPECNSDYKTLSEAHQNCLSTNTTGTLNVTIMQMYDFLSSNLTEFTILTNSMPANSCEPENVALYWLAQDIVDNDTPEEKWANRFLLASLFLSWTGDIPCRWEESTAWMTHKDICYWSGVNCSFPSGDVEELTLSNNNLQISGGLPDALFELKTLTHIDLSFNYLEVPSLQNAIQKLVKLEVLDLESNYVHGPLPFHVLPTSLVTLKLLSMELHAIATEIGRLTNLEHIRMTSSSVTNSLPSEIGKLTRLKRLELADTFQLNALLPSEIGLLTSLEWIDLRSAGAGSGGFELVSEIGLLTKLEHVNFGFCGGYGTLPTQLGSLTKLVWLHLAGFEGLIDYESAGTGQAKKGYSGEIPSELGRLTNIEYLRLGGNDLSGKIPSEIGQLAALRAFDVAFNKLTGTIPNEVYMLSNLEILRLHGYLAKQGAEDTGRNLIAGTLPEGLGDLPSLTCLSVDGTLISGSVPSGVCKHSDVDVFISPLISVCECCSCKSGNGCTLNDQSKHGERLI